MERRDYRRAGDIVRRGTDGLAAAGSHPPLKPGPSAGVQAAQQVIRPGLALIGAGAIIALVVVTTAGNGGKGSQPGSQSVPATAP